MIPENNDRSKVEAHVTIRQMEIVLPIELDTWHKIM